jgi:hypothetical protein
MLERKRNVQRIGKFFTNLILTLLVAVLSTACSRSASKAPVLPATPTEASLAIDQVQITQGTGIYLSGRSTIPAGECIRTELLADGKPVDWWPGDVCVEVDVGQWEMLVGLGHDNAPAQLPPGVQYEIHAWWPAQPDTVSTRFPFDLDGPK